MNGHRAHTCTYRVCYRDTDQAGHMYYANYFVLFEIARAEWIRSHGTSYRTWEEERGLFLPVRDAQAKYLQSALYDDLLEIEILLRDWTGATLTFAYRIRREGELLCEGVTVHALLDRVTRRPSRQLGQLLRELGIEPVS